MKNEFYLFLKRDYRSNIIANLRKKRKQIILIYKKKWNQLFDLKISRNLSDGIKEERRERTRLETSNEDLFDAA